MALFAADVPVELVVAIIPILGGVLTFAFWLFQRGITKAEKERDDALAELTEYITGVKFSKLKAELADAQDRSDRLYKDKQALQDKYDNDIGERDEQISVLKEALEKVTQGQAAPKVAVAALQAIKEQEELQEEEEKEEEQEATTSQSGQTGAWVIAPCSAQAPNIQEVWKFDLERSVISVGWGELGDISAYDEEKLRKEIDKKYKDVSSQGRGHYFSMLWKFYHRINVGDTVIARHGTKRIAAVGIVKRKAYYKPQWSPARGQYPDSPQYPNHLDVEWQKSPRDKDFPKAVFGLLTLSFLPEARVHSLVGKP